MAGKLDTIRHSDRMFMVILENGQAIKGVADELVAAQLPDFWGKAATVSGTAIFRPSGAVLRIDADAIEPASDDVSVWSRMPTPVFHVLESGSLYRSQTSRTGVNAVIGRWPGEETDGDISAALDDLS